MIHVLSFFKGVGFKCFRNGSFFQKLGNIGAAFHGIVIFKVQLGCDAQVDLFCDGTAEKSCRAVKSFFDFFDIFFFCAVNGKIYLCILEIFLGICYTVSVLF